MKKIAIYRSSISYLVSVTVIHRFEDDEINAEKRTRNSKINEKVVS